MKKIISYLLIGLVVMAAASCGNLGFKKTKSGLLYKIISDEKGAPAKRGEILKFSVVEKVRDSVLFTSANGLPAYARVDSIGPEYNPAEVFMMLRKGDSAIVVELVDTLLRRYGQLPPFLKKGDKISIYFKVMDVFATQELADKDREQAGEAEKEKEIKQIEAYLAKNNIAAQKTTGGVYYQIQAPGNGPKADSGKMVSIRYTGYKLDGTFFDSNVDSTKQSQPHPLTPFQFQSATSGAIPGMLEAIKEFKKGDKGRMFIPGSLAYGQRGQGAIKPFDDLIFDIEVVDVTDAPPPQQQPNPMQQMPRSMPPPPKGNKQK
jgi:FKBP-type peptidyl-prolyl cis-trans isomerase FkpA